MMFNIVWRRCEREEKKRKKEQTGAGERREDDFEVDGEFVSSSGIDVERAVDLHVQVRVEL